MVRPQFEEKSYEGAFNAELELDNRWRTFSPGQVAEKRLGVDVLARAGAQHPFWASVNVAHRQGRRIRRRGVPDEVFNVFLQYKTSHYIVGTRGLHLGYFGGPYYRFRPRDQFLQLQTLQRLEASMGAAGVVLYAAPAFHKMAELRDAQRGRRIIAESVTVSPGDFGSAHTAYNFAPGIGARFNPEPEPADLVEATKALDPDRFSSSPLPFLDAVSALYNKLEEDAPDPELWKDLSAEADRALTDLETTAQAYEFLMIAGLTALQGTRWYCLSPRA